MIKISDDPIGLPDRVSKAQKYVINITGEYTVSSLVDALMKKDDSGCIHVRNLSGRLVDSAWYSDGRIVDDFTFEATKNIAIDIYHCYAEIGAYGNLNRVDYELSV